MTEALLELGRESLLLALTMAAPLVLAAFIAGTVTAVIGMVTQVRDPAVGLAPRVAAVVLAVGLTAPTIGRQALAFATRALGVVAQVR